MGIDPAAFLTTFGLIFIAELGDKTQLTAMALAVRYSWKQVFAGVAAAFVLLNLAAVAVGQILFTLVPMAVIQGISGALFCLFGILTLKSSGQNSPEKELALQTPILTSFILILLSELGDKTQIVTAAMAAQYAGAFSVFAGSTLALWSVSLIGIFLGQGLVRVIPMRTIHRAAGILFILLGVGMWVKLLAEKL